MSLIRWPMDWSELLSEAGGEMQFRVEERMEDDELVVRADLPGVDPDKDVEITLTDHTLRIQAERRQETKTEDAKGYRSEVRYGTFVRTLALPTAADSEDVKATYTDGVLEVHVPLDARTATSRKVAITRT
jgi:HSP20 family protein